MKTTPIPELRNLAPGFVIQRCTLCHELVFADEACRTDHEAVACPARVEIERKMEAVA